MRQLLVTGARFCSIRRCAGVTGRMSQVMGCAHRRNALQLQRWASSAPPVYYKETLDGKSKSFVVSSHGIGACKTGSDVGDDVTAAEGRSAVGRRVVHALQRFFMPSGYPDTCTSDYWDYQKWLNLQLFLTEYQWASGAALYVMSTHALLSAVGIGSGEAAALSASINWVLKDGLACVGVMLMANRVGNRFDLHVKRSKFYSDILHNVGIAVEMLTPLFPPLFVVMGSVAVLAKSLAGMASGAVRATVNRHFAAATKGKNLGDITAKAQSQGVAAYLVGMGTGIGVSLAFPGTGGIAGAYVLLTGFHMLAGYKSLCSLNLTSLNLSRGHVVTSAFVDAILQESSVALEPTRRDTLNSIEVPTPKQIGAIDPFVTAYHLSTPLAFGVPLSDVAKTPDGIREALQQRSGDASCAMAEGVFAISASGEEGVAVALSHSATERDQLQALLQYSAFAALKKSRSGADGLLEEKLLLSQAAELARKELPRLEATLVAAGWSTKYTLLATSSAPRFSVTGGPKDESAMTTVPVTGQEIGGETVTTRAH